MPRSKESSNAKTGSRSNAKTGSAKSSTSTAKTAKSSSQRPSAPSAGKPGASRKTSTKTQGRQGVAGPALRPIRERQTRAQLIATVALASGVPRETVDTVARSLSQTLTRHLIRGGSGRVEIPFLGGALYVGRRSAQKARTMHSPILGRMVQIPARPAQPAARFRALESLKAVVCGRR